MSDHAPPKLKGNIRTIVSENSEPSGDIPKKKTCFAEIVDNGKLFPCKLDGEINLLKGVLDISLDTNDINPWKRFLLGGAGNIQVSVRDENLCVVENGDPTWIVFENSNEAKSWAKYLCSSVFSNEPNIISTTKREASVSPVRPPECLSTRSRMSPRNSPRVLKNISQFSSSGIESTRGSISPKKRITGEENINDSFIDRSKFSPNDSLFSDSRYESPSTGNKNIEHSESIQFQPSSHSKLLQLRIRDAMALHESIALAKYKAQQVEEKRLREEEEKDFQRRLLIERRKFRLQGMQQGMKEAINSEENAAELVKVN